MDVGIEARFYEPSTGRFISEDPAGFGGGDINMYVYAGNNPILLIDPYGLCESLVSFDLSFNSFFNDSQERANTRYLIETADILTQGQLNITLAFDIGGALATGMDIIYADVPVSNKLKAAAWDAYGLLGAVGMVPTPKTVAVGLAFDLHSAKMVESYIDPLSAGYQRRQRNSN